MAPLGFGAMERLIERFLSRDATHAGACSNVAEGPAGVGAQHRMTRLSTYRASRLRARVSASGIALLVALATAGPTLADPSFLTRDVAKFVEGVNPLLANDGTIVLYGSPAGNGAMNAFAWDGTTAVEVQTTDELPIYNLAFSRDGSTIGGTFGDGTYGETQAFLWSGGTFTELGFLTDHSGRNGWERYSNVAVLSNDGSVAAGESLGSDGLLHAVKWTGGTLVDLGVVSNGDTTSQDISGDGSTVLVKNGLTFALHRDNTLTTVTGLDVAAKKGLSYDGSVLVGAGNYGWSHAVRIVNGVVSDLGVLSGYDASAAEFVSQDGEVVVGNIYKAGVPSTLHVFRWQDGTMDDLGALGDGTYIVANAISGDGNYIVGRAAIDVDNSDYRAFYWDADGGLRTVESLLTDAGLDIQGWTLREAYGVSDDGGTIMGVGGHGEHDGLWWARCVTETSCVVIDQKTAAASFASLAAAGETSNLFLDDTLATTVDATASAGPNGSVFAVGQVDTDPSHAGGLGVSFRPFDTVTAGIAVATGTIDTPLAFDGRSLFTGTTATVAVASNPSMGLFWQGAATVGQFDGSVERGYLNGNTPATSSGETSATGWGAMALLGWRFAEIMPSTSFSPYLSYSVASTAYEGWTETSGPLPASFSAFTTTTQLFRAGASFDHAWDNGASASLGLAYVHRASDGGTISGAIPSVLTLSVDGATGEADWVELSLGARVPLGDSLTAGARLVGRVPANGDASVYAQASLSLAF